MDLFAGLFGLVLLTLGVGLTYQWGIKPDRENKKRKAEQMRRTYAGCILKNFAETPPLAESRLHTTPSAPESNRKKARPEHSTILV